MTPERWVALGVGCLLLAIAVFTALKSQRRGDGALSTLGLFTLVWGCALVLFAVPLIDYSTTSAKVWLMVYGSIATFILGSLLAQRRLRSMPKVAEEQRQRPDPKRLRLAWLMFALVGLLGFIAYVHAVDVTVGWRKIFDDPELVRSIQTTSLTFSDAYGPWKLLIYGNQVAVVLWALGLRERAFSGRWLPVRFLGVLSFAPFLFTGERNLMIVAIIWAAMFQLLYAPPARLRRLVSGLAVAAVGLLIIFSVLGDRVGKSLEGNPEIASELTTRSFDSLALPYLYATGNIPALGGLIEDPIRPETNGELTFSSVFKLLHGLGLWGQPEEMVGAFYPIPFETFNNFSWLNVFYSDFGLVGILLLPFLFAYITSVVVTRAVRRRTLLSIWTGSILLYCVSYTFDGYKFFDTIVTEFLLLGLVVVPFIRSDLGPKEIYRRVRVWIRDKPAIAAAGAGVLVLLAGVGLVGFITAESPQRLPETQRELTNKLQSVADLAERTRVEGNYPTPQALASRLHANDPEIKYVVLADVGNAPEPETVGVSVSESWLNLQALAADGNLVSLTREGDSETIKLIRQRIASVGQELVKNGRFENRLRDWVYWPGEVGTGELISPGHLGKYAFRFEGAGVDGSLVQLEQPLPIRAPADACFKFSVWARSQNLSRTVFVWASLDNQNGESVLQLLLGPDENGIGPGTLPWRRYTATGSAGEEISRARVFALDMGQTAVSGSIEVDDLSLKRTSC